MYLLENISIFIVFNYSCLGHVQRIPNLNGKCYVNLQDINLGFIVGPSTRGVDKHCSEALITPLWVEIIEAMKYAIIEINNNTELLPNVTIGYVFLDTCSRDIVALARALYFIPDTERTWNRSREPFVEECGKHIR